MTTNDLQSLIDDGKFHHATEKPNLGIHSGLWIYRINCDAPRGFEVAGFFSGYKGGEYREEYQTAISLVRNSGVSVGSFGRG